MFGGNEVMSPADIAAVTGGDKDGWGGNGAMWLVIFVLFFAFGGGGFGGGWGNRGNMLNSDNNAIQAAMQRGFDAQYELQRMDGLTRGQFDSAYALNAAINGVGMNMMQGFSGVNAAICNQGYQTQQGFNGVGQELCQGFAGVQAAIAQNGYNAQLCCCGTEKEILQSRYDAAKNTCDIVNAIRDDGNATRALITQTEMQNLRDKLADRDRDIQSRDFQLSQLSQTRSIISELQPVPKPAYASYSPFQTFGPFGGWGSCGNGWNGYNNGCGCGSCA